jgi:hypothetical protein
MRLPIVVVLLAVVVSLLSATILREPIATAAQAAQSVLIVNKPAVAVPVREQARTVLISRGALDAEQPAITFDASRYAQIRLTMRPSSSSCPSGTEVVVAAPYWLDVIDVPRNQDVTWRIELPGRKVSINNADTLTCSVSYVLFGRAN